MTSKPDFTDEEWTRLKRSPFVAGMAISLADPGGPIELYHETTAALRSVRDAAGGARGELVAEIARDAVQDASARRNPLGDFKPGKGANAGPQIVEELAGVNAIVSQKASAEEATAVREWLISAAQDAANAAKEGGFLGFHAERVSQGEQAMLDRLSKTLVAPEG